MLSIYKNKYSQNNGIRKQLKNCAKYNAKSYVKLLSDIETIFNLSNYLGTYYVVINNISTLSRELMYLQTWKFETLKSSSIEKF